MRPRTQIQRQVKKEPCREIDDVDVDILPYVILSVESSFSSWHVPHKKSHHFVLIGYHPNQF